MRNLLWLLGLLATPALAEPAWDIQLTEPLDLTRPVAIIDLDPDGVTAGQVAALRARGVMPICYISVGTLEDYRADRDEFPPQVLGRRYDDWPDEVFLDIRAQARLLPLMRARFQRCADLGFVAIDPDNQDVHVNDSGFPVTAADSVAWMRALAALAHGMGLKIGQKNVPDLTPDLVSLLDFAVTENCLTDGWCDRMAPYVAAGKPVLAIEYGAGDQAAACAQASRMGLSMIFKPRELDARGTACLK